MWTTIPQCGNDPQRLSTGQTGFVVLPRLRSTARTPSLKETASTDSPSVQALVPEQALNKRDSVPVPFGRTDLDREISKETGGSAEGSGRDRLD